MAREVLKRKFESEGSNVRAPDGVTMLFIRELAAEFGAVLFAIERPKTPRTKNAPATLNEKLDTCTAKVERYAGYVRRYNHRIKILEEDLQHGTHAWLFADIFVEAPLFGGRKGQIEEQLKFDTRALAYCAWKLSHYKSLEGRLRAKHIAESEAILFDTL